MVRATDSVLNERQTMPTALTKYGVASGMLGFLMKGDRSESLRLWPTYQSGILGAASPICCCAC